MQTEFEIKQGLRQTKVKVKSYKKLQKVQEKFAGTKFLCYLCRRKRETEGNKKYMSQKTDVFCDIVFCAAGLRLQCAKQGGIIDISLLPAEDLK